jgi:hypothetical protein
VVLSWCDVCQDEDTRTEGRSYTLGIGNGRLLEVELCDRHAKPVEEVIALLSDHGKPPSDELPAPAKRGPYKKRETAQTVTPAATAGRARRAPLQQIDPRSDEAAKRNMMFCLLCAVGFASEYGLNRHLRDEHNLSSMPRQGDIYGGVCPACGEDQGNVRALSNHTTFAHHMAGPVGRLFALHAGEDKYGVVAAARQRLVESAGTLL